MPHPIADGRPIRPWVAGERELRIDGRLDGLARARKHEIQAVARRSALERAMLGERLADQPIVIGQYLRVAIAERLEESRRALDVREDHRDGPGRKGGRVGVPWDDDSAPVPVRRPLRLPGTPTVRRSRDSSTPARAVLGRPGRVRLAIIDGLVMTLTPIDTSRPPVDRSGHRRGRAARARQRDIHDAHPGDALPQDRQTASTWPTSSSATGLSISSSVSTPTKATST